MNRKGYTLVELIATIIIIGVLFAILSYVARQQIDKAKKNAFREDIRSVLRSAEMYKEENNLKNFNIDISKLELGKVGNLTGNVTLTNGVLSAYNISNGKFCGNGSSDGITIEEKKCAVPPLAGAAKAYLEIPKGTLPSSYDFDLLEEVNIVAIYVNDSNIILGYGIGYVTSDLNETNVNNFKNYYDSYLPYKNIVISDIETSKGFSYVVVDACKLPEGVGSETVTNLCNASFADYYDPNEEPEDESKQVIEINY